MRDELLAMPNVGDVLAWPSAEEFWRDRSGPPLDLLYVDVHLPHMSGVDLVEIVRGKFPDLPIVMLTGVASDETIFQALRVGATGYLLKAEVDNIVEYTRMALEGGAAMTPGIALRVLQSFRKSSSGEEPNLTTREQQVLKLLVEGLSGPDVARRLGVSENTMRTHIKNVYRKLNVKSRVEMMHRAADLGLL